MAFPHDAPLLEPFSLFPFPLPSLFFPLALPCLYLISFPQLAVLHLSPGEDCVDERILKHPEIIHLFLCFSSHLNKMRAETNCPST